MQRIYHWKHGWIPLDHEAAVQKYGSAGAAKHGLGGSVPEQHPTVGARRPGSAPAPIKSSTFQPMPKRGQHTVDVQRSMFDAQGLSDDELQANTGFYSYTRAGYMHMNGMLRGTESGSSVTKAKVESMDKLISERGLKLDEGITVQRGSGIPPGIKYEVGATAVEPGYTSASLDPEISAQFATTPNEDTGEEGYLFDVQVPAGTRVLVTPVTDGEGEVILPRNSKYRVKKVDHQKREITMELIP